MSLDSLIRLQAGYNAQNAEGLNRLSETLGNIIQQRGQRSFEQDAMNFFKDKEASPENMAAFQSMYPNAPAQEVWKTASQIGTLRKAQRIKDQYKSLREYAKNARARGENFDPMKMMEEIPDIDPDMVPLIAQYKQLSGKTEWKEADPGKEYFQTRDGAPTGITRMGPPAKVETESVTLYGPGGKTIRASLPKGKEFIPPEGWSLQAPSQAPEPEWKEYVKELMQQVNPKTQKAYTKVEAIEKYKTSGAQDHGLWASINAALDPASTDEQKQKARNALTEYQKVMSPNIVLGATPQGGIVTGQGRGPLSLKVTDTPVEGPIVDVKSNPLPEKAEDRLTGALDMFDLLDVLEKNADVGVPVPGVGQATTYVQSKLGVKSAQDFLTAKNQLAANAQSIIKGIPSNFDVQTFLKTLPNETDTESEKKTKIAQSKKLLTNAITTGVQNYENSKFIIPEYIKNRVKSKANNGTTVHPLQGKQAGRYEINGKVVAWDGQKEI